MEAPPWTRRHASSLTRTVARVLIGLVWVVAAAAKITDPIGSANAVRAYQILPDSLAAVVGYALPWAEMSLGLLLVLGIGTRLAAGLTVAMMTAFVTGIAQAWARGMAIDCGCFGGGGNVSHLPVTEYLTVIVRDTAIAAFATWLVLRPVTFLSLLSPASGPTTTRENDPSDPTPKDN